MNPCVLLLRMGGRKAKWKNRRTDCGTFMNFSWWPLTAISLPSQVMIVTNTTPTVDTGYCIILIRSYGSNIFTRTFLENNTLFAQTVLAYMA